ncbi:DUF5590 domain-containing protein [Peribacillus sp. SCS-155]|uniref:cell wall elongation regulator TseB-like domain-containing protein n=1 Tax=Peribacillus sedimenti TaxID=3115297 RepID=UPI0039060D91
MKKWVIFAAALVICIGGVTAAAYIHALGPKKEAADIAFKEAKDAAGIVTMDDFYVYNGKDSYNVVVGETKKGTKKVIWLPNKKGSQPVIENYDTGISKSEITRIANKQLKPAKIISLKLGMEQDVPLWEVTYLDKSNRYNYDYYDFKSGEWLKYYRSI